jgi:uncharacterized protein YqeY
MIIDEIKKENIEAMKNKDTVARNLYSVLLNKLKLEEIKKREAGQPMTDADCSVVMQKMIKELTEEKASYESAGRAECVAELQKQLSLVEKFMPKMLSKEEIKDIILALDDKTIPVVMKHFKANYNGQCDMRLVQEVLKSL